MKIKGNYITGHFLANPEAKCKSKYIVPNIEIELSTEDLAKQLTEDEILDIHHIRLCLPPTEPEKCECTFGYGVNGTCQICGKPDGTGNKGTLSYGFFKTDKNFKPEKWSACCKSTVRTEMANEYYYCEHCGRACYLEPKPESLKMIEELLLSFSSINNFDLG